MDTAARPLDLLVVGDANPDIVLRGDVRPLFGQAEQLLTSADVVLGGSAAITACGAARLGVRTALLARIGADSLGSVVRSALADRGVVTDLLREDDGEATGVSVILSAADDRAILTLTGANTGTSAVDATDAILATARHVHVAGFFLMPELAAGTADLFARAHRLGLTTSLDTNWDPAESWSGVHAVLAHTDVFLPNVGELLAIAGVADDAAAPADRRHLIESAARAITALGPRLVVKAGEDGALGWGPEGCVSAPAYPAAVVDTTGAGDSFVAGFLAAWLRAVPFAEAVLRAAACGSLSTRAVGGTSAQATTPEVDALLGQ